MADPLSIFATVAGLVSAAATVSTEIYGFIANVKDAPKGMESLKAETDSLSSVLRQLSSTLQNDFDTKYPFPPSSAEDLKLVLNSCRSKFGEIEEKLNDYRTGRFLGKLRFVFADKDIAKLLRSLEAHKQTLAITCLLLLKYAPVASEFCPVSKRC